MDSERIRILAIGVGLFLSVLGFFLPWGEQDLIPGIMEPMVVFLGVELVIGWVAFMGCVVTVASLFFLRMGNKRYWRALALLGGLITLVSSLA